MEYWIWTVKKGAEAQWIEFKTWSMMLKIINTRRDYSDSYLKLFWSKENSQKINEWMYADMQRNEMQRIDILKACHFEFK